MSSQLTRQEANNIKQTLDEMSRKNAEAINKTIEAFKKGEITLEDYRKKIDEINRSQLQVDKTTQELGLTTKNVSGKTAIAWTAVAGAVIAVSKAVVDLIRNTVNYADEINDMAEKWGFTTKELQEFNYWATLNGTTVDSLLTGMRGLVNQAEAGSSAFEKLGVKVKNADGSLKDQRTLFLETIDALRQVENQTERNALQFEIFGRAGIELGQVINQSSDELNRLSKEAEDLGIILSQETMDKAGEFNDTLDKFRLSFKSIMAEFLAGTPEAEEKLQEFFYRITEQMETWMPQFTKIVTKLIEMLITALVNNLPEILDILIESINSMPWFEIIWNIVKALLKGLIQTIKGTFEGIFTGKWFGDLFTGKNDGTISNSVYDDVDSAVSSISSNTSSSTISTDNSTYNLSVNVNGTGYSQEDAKVLADEVIKQIATKKQARG